MSDRHKCPLVCQLAVLVIGAAAVLLCALAIDIDSDALFDGWLAYSILFHD